MIEISWKVPVGDVDGNDNQAIYRSSVATHMANGILENLQFAPQAVPQFT